YGAEHPIIDFCIKNAVIACVLKEIATISASSWGEHELSDGLANRIETFFSDLAARTTCRSTFSLVYGDLQSIITKQDGAFRLRSIDLDGLHYGLPEEDFAWLESRMRILNANVYRDYLGRGLNLDRNTLQLLTAFQFLMEF